MYIAYVSQKNVGCDYTIGCGQTIWTLHSDCWNDAVAELRRMVIGMPDSDEHTGYWDEKKLGKVVLYEVSCVKEMPLDVWYKEGHEAIVKLEHRICEEVERTVYEKLKAKYEAVKA